MAGAEGLEAEPARVIVAVPGGDGSFGFFQRLARDDRELPPGIALPGVPRDVTGGAAAAAVALEGMEAVVERIVDFTLDEAAADPEAGDAV